MAPACMLTHCFVMAAVGGRGEAHQAPHAEGHSSKGAGVLLLAGCAGARLTRPSDQQDALRICPGA